MNHSGLFSKIWPVVVAFTMAALHLATPGNEALAEDQLATKVTLQRTPEDGIQPQAVVDEKGTIHLIYFKGEAIAGDVFYVRSADGGAAWSTPLRVNSQQGSVIATGTVRGAQIALGKNNRVHVSWNGSSVAQPKSKDKTEPLLYARLNDAGDAFEEQRNLVTWASEIDGGGTLAADAKGNVFVFWHANAGVTDEADRAVFMARSSDEGSTFGRETKINPDATGACACCQMRALIGKDGALYVLYRAAGNNENRDATLLVSRDGGEKFSSAVLDKWKLMACPMSTFALAQGTDKTAPILAAWETEQQVYGSTITPAATLQISPPVAAPDKGQNRKHPALATNNRGEVLWTWTEGTGWARGGSLSWQVYDAESKPLMKKGREDGVPVWGLPTAVALPDGNFVLIY